MRTQYHYVMNWWAYVERVASGDSQATIAAAARVSPPTVSRWSTQKQGVDPQNVATFARSYGRPVLEALVAAGFLTAEEAEERPTAAPSLGALTDDELLAEIKIRMEMRHHAQAQEPGSEAGGTAVEQPAAIGALRDAERDRLISEQVAEKFDIDLPTVRPERPATGDGTSEGDGTNTHGKGGRRGA